VYETIHDVDDLRKRLVQTWFDFDEHIIDEWMNEWNYFKTKRKLYAIATYIVKYAKNSQFELSKRNFEASEIISRIFCELMGHLKIWSQHWYKIQYMLIIQNAPIAQDLLSIPTLQAERIFFLYVTLTAASQNSLKQSLENVRIS